MKLSTFTISNFNQLVVPKHIKLVVLDKDNCFAKPHTNEVFPLFVSKFNELKKGDYKLVILSNTAGLKSADPSDKMALELERNTGVEVVRHRFRKPFCFNELQKYNVEPPKTLIVGDRIATDVLMAKMNNAESVWIRMGEHPNWLNRLESMWF